MNISYIFDFMPIVKLMGYGLFSLWVLWVLFLAIMNLNEAKISNTLPTPIRGLAYATLYIGLLVDFLVQVTVATVMWLELPREFTVSGRVARLIKSGQGYRYDLAIWFRDNLLKPFDRSGGHG